MPVIVQAIVPFIQVSPLLVTYKTKKRETGDFSNDYRRPSVHMVLEIVSDVHDVLIVMKLKL